MSELNTRGNLSFEDFQHQLNEVESLLLSLKYLLLRVILENMKVTHDDHEQKQCCAYSVYLDLERLRRIAEKYELRESNAESD